MNYERTVYRPKWEQLRNGEGTHLVFGATPREIAAPINWLTLDIDLDLVHIPFDILNTPWPWKDIAAIHCVGMLFQWSKEDGQHVVQQAYDKLLPHGVLWLAEVDRDRECAHYESNYDKKQLRKLARDAGFFVEDTDTLYTTGRSNVPGYPVVTAYRCEKCILA